MSPEPRQDAHDDGWHVCLHRVEVVVPVIHQWRGGKAPIGQYSVILAPDSQPYVGSRVLGPFPDGLAERLVHSTDLYPPGVEGFVCPWLSVVLDPVISYPWPGDFYPEEAVWGAAGWEWQAVVHGPNGEEGIERNPAFGKMIHKPAFLLPEYV